MSQSKPALELWLERGLFASRWLMAPFYLGLVGALAVLLAVFVQEIVHEAGQVIAAAKADDAIMLVLSLIDLSLAGNLLLIVMLSGYESFVSKIDIGDHADRPEWMGTLGFSGMKMKLMASIVAISAVALLRAFMSLAEPGAAPDAAKLGWMVGIHLTFVVSAVMLAVMDWLEGKSGH